MPTSPTIKNLARILGATCVCAPESAHNEFRIEGPSLAAPPGVALQLARTPQTPFEAGDGHMDPNDRPKGRRRIACIDCHLIEPEPGTWVEARCPRCAPPKPKINYTLDPRTDDLRGRVFGRLTVESFAFVKGEVAFWNCRCCCGATITVARTYLRTSPVPSCGCHAREAHQQNGQRSRINLTGQRFGRWLVTSFAERKSGRTLWNCVCDCGTVSQVAATHLRQGKSHSCGCLMREMSYAHGRKAAAIRKRNALRGTPRQLAKDFTGAKLTAKQAFDVRVEYAKGGVSHQQLAQRYGVSDTSISSITRGDSFRDVGGPRFHRANKLNPDLVRAIRAEYAKGGVTFEDVAVRHGVSRAAIKAVVDRRIWGHVE